MNNYIKASNNPIIDTTENKPRKIGSHSNILLPKEDNQSDFSFFRTSDQKPLKTQTISENFLSSNLPKVSELQFPLNDIESNSEPTTLSRLRAQLFISTISAALYSKTIRGAISVFNLHAKSIFPELAIEKTHSYGILQLNISSTPTNKGKQNSSVKPLTKEPTAKPRSGEEIANYLESILIQLKPHFYPSSSFAKSYQPTNHAPKDIKISYYLDRLNIDFPTEILRFRLSSENRHLKKNALLLCKSLEKQLRNKLKGENIVRQVEMILEANQSSIVHKEYVAAKLNMSVRSLSRWLSRENTTFREISSAKRYETSSKALKETSIPIRDVAASVGYSDISNFVYAFKKHTGLSPSRYRRKFSTRFEHPLFTNPTSTISAPFKNYD